MQKRESLSSGLVIISVTEKERDRTLGNVFQRSPTGSLLNMSPKEWPVQTPSQQQQIQTERKPNGKEMTQQTTPVPK